MILNTTVSSVHLYSICLKTLCKLVCIQIYVGVETSYHCFYWYHTAINHQYYIAVLATMAALY